jgi:hypothetical protein
MELPEFREWPKIPRLNREMIVTEKIDGTNAAVIVHGLLHPEVELEDPAWVAVTTDEGNHYAVAAQSRKHIISPEQDNFSFAKWVRNHAQELADVLGVGYHFGEWYGSGIQRGYGLEKGEKRFMLFNVDRWADHTGPWVEGMEVATELNRSDVFDTDVIRREVEMLRAVGSSHVPGFMNPEGVVAYHKQGNVSFKVTLEGDAEWKGKQK